VGINHAHPLFQQSGLLSQKRQQLWSFDELTRQDRQGPIPAGGRGFIRRKAANAFFGRMIRFRLGQKQMGDLFQSPGKTILGMLPPDFFGIVPIHDYF
jgi:hypothetical protein